MNDNDLETKLKEIFAKTSKFANPESLGKVELCIKLGSKAYIDEDYHKAKLLFTKALEKAELKHHKLFSLNMKIDCSENLFHKEPNENDFQQICNDYEQLLEMNERPEHYQLYINFLSQSFNDNGRNLMNEQAVKIAERATSIFPLNASLNAILSNLYYLIGEEEKAYDTMIDTCKLAYDNPDFLYSKFFGRIFELAPGSQDSKTMPINILINYKDKEIFSDSQVLYDYAELVLDYSPNHEQLGYWLLTKVYELDQDMPDLKEEIFGAFHEAVLAAKPGKERSDILEHFNTFAKKYDLNNDSLWRNLWSAHEKKDNEDFESIDEDPEEEDEELKTYKIPEEKLDGNMPSLESTLEKKIKVLLPKQIKEKLDEYVMGQEQAKKSLSVAASNHLLRISGKVKGVDKTNVLLLGPTGCGKSFSGRILADILDLPFVIYDTSKITESGYVGDDAQDCITMLYEQTGHNLKRTEQGIIFLDEADKIKIVQGTGKDISGEGAQQQLLKLIEGSNVKVQLNRHKSIIINTENIMFIIAGAFSDTLNGESLGEAIKGPLIGFNACQEETIGQTLRRLTDEDLREYGFLPEFAGRLQKRAVLDELTEAQLKEILIKPKNALMPQYEKQFNFWKIKLEVTDDAMTKIAEEAYKLKAGARSLKTICESMFDDYLFELPGSDTKVLKIDAKEVEEALKKCRS